MTKFSDFSHFICALIWFFTLSFAVSSSVVTKQITERYKSVDVKDHHALTCICSNSSTTERDIDRTTVEKMLNESLKCFDDEEICMMLQFCKKCTLKSETCRSSNETKDYDCKKNTYILKKNILEDNNFENTSIYHLRSKRSEGVCPYPEKIKNSRISCKVWDSKVECIQTCIIGYTLKEGTSLKYHCLRREDKWKPSEFKECKPYVNCTVSFVSGGSLSCYTATTKKSPRCDIECKRFEDKKALPKRTYTCNKRGKWNPKLPFCVKAGTNITLVDPPEEID